MTRRKDEVPEPVLQLSLHDLLLFGGRVVRRRRARGWNQIELARRTSIQSARLSRLERGRAVPKLQELVRLRAILGGTLDELIFEPTPLSTEALGQSLREVEACATDEQIALVGKLLRFLALAFRYAPDREQGHSC
jgi:transcriptional regulator with XRE-family HTH domain